VKTEIELMEVLFFNLSLELTLVMKTANRFRNFKRAPEHVGSSSPACLNRIHFLHLAQILLRLLLIFSARGIHASKMNAAKPFGRSQNHS